MDDVYTVPLSTFWRPVEIGEYVEDPRTVTELNHKNSKVLHNFANNMDMQLGKYLSAEMKEYAENVPEYRDRVERMMKPVQVNNLRPIEV